jgi:hypothetical protein
MSHADPTERRDPITDDRGRDDVDRGADRGADRDRGVSDRDRGTDRDRGVADRDGRRGDERWSDDGGHGREADDRHGERREPIADDGRRDAGGARSGDGSVGIDDRWEATQAQFLESPREAVAAADELVSEVIDDVRRRLDGERAAVADTWKRDGADTEDLRTAMLRYREVLDRLGPQR